MLDIAQSQQKHRYVVKGPRAAADPMDKCLWFIADSKTGMPLGDSNGIKWFTRNDAKARAAQLG